MSDAMRFDILRNMSRIRLERTISKRTQELCLFDGATQIASKLIVYKRGKVSQILFYITDLGVTTSNP